MLKYFKETMNINIDAINIVKYVLEKRTTFLFLFSAISLRNFGVLI